jgi:hypothetical protein
MIFLKIVDNLESSYKNKIPTFSNANFQYGLSETR